ncbi:hypothetical protein PLESTM_000448500, partial [Pleodorina starrii]
MHEERAAFQHAERSLGATNRTLLCRVGLKRGPNASWRHPRWSWSLQPKPFVPSPWAERRRPPVAVALSPSDEQLLQRMMDDPGISDDRSDGTAAASTQAG